MSSRRWLCCVAAAVGLGGLALLAPIASYRLGFARGVLQPAPPRESEFVDTGCPPKRIHQIFIAETSAARVPDDWEKRGRQTWIDELAADEVRFEDGVPVVDERDDRTWRYFFWDGPAIQRLLAASYPELLDTYRGYSRWVQRVDLARYRPRRPILIRSRSRRRRGRDVNISWTGRGGAAATT